MINHGHHSGIGIFEDVLSDLECESILEQFANSDRKKEGQTVRPDGSVFKSPSKSSIDLDLADVEEITRDKVHRQAVHAFVEYQNQFPSLRSLEFKTMGYMIQMYPQNRGEFKWHCDATNPDTYRRQVAMILYLNTVDEGGETEFFEQQLSISPKRGRCTFFPPFWTHRHRGKVPLSHDKFVITSFFERDFAAKD